MLRLQRVYLLVLTLLRVIHVRGRGIQHLHAVLPDIQPRNGDWLVIQQHGQGRIGYLLLVWILSSSDRPMDRLLVLAALLRLAQHLLGEEV